MNMSAINNMSTQKAHFLRGGPTFLAGKVGINLLIICCFNLSHFLTLLLKIRSNKGASPK